jgi:hypothetical protein
MRCFLHSRGPFDDCQQLGYTALKSRKVDDELERIWKDVVVSLIDALSLHLPRHTE